ncbi:MAG TPA: hypothetical protein VK249_31950 [Anaerolineales bacterium]|nr:hypothetical protein [Anaerolineales bacterium]
MSYRLRVSISALVLLAATLACNMQFDQVPPPNEAQTAAALTVQAALTTPALTSTATRAPSQTPSATGLPIQTTTLTPTFSVPMLTVRESTNCRTGPGEEYEVIFTYLKGKKLEIVGRYDPGNFWLVKSNESPTGTCWLWGQYVDVTGSYWTVASVTPPPTSTIAPPRAPGIQEWHFSCSADTLTFTVNWVDNATNETGYRIFRDGEQLVELPANSTTYTDTFTFTADQGVEYYLQVFAPSGTANSSVMRMRC